MTSMLNRDQLAQAAQAALQPQQTPDLSQWAVPTQPLMMAPEQQAMAPAINPMDFSADAPQQEQLPLIPSSAMMQSLGGPVTPPPSGAMSADTRISENSDYNAQRAINRIQSALDGAADNDQLSAVRLNEAAGQADVAALSAAQVASDKAEKMQPILESLTAEGAALYADQQAAVQKAQQATQEQMLRVQDAVEVAANTRINSWWSDAGTAATILGVISQALHGASGKSGMSPLDTIIANDIRKQEANMQQKNQNVAAQKGLLKDMYDQLGNMEAAKSAVYKVAMMNADARMQAIANQMKTPEAQAAYQASHAAIWSKLAEQNNALTQQVNHRMLQGAEAQGNISARADMLRAQKQEMMERMQSAASGKSNESKDDPVIRRKVQAYVVTAREAVALIDSLVAGNHPDTKAAVAELIHFVNFLKTGANRAPSDQDTKLIRDEIGGPRLDTHLFGTYQMVDKKNLMMMRKRILEGAYSRDQVYGTAVAKALQDDTAPKDESETEPAEGSEADE